MIKLGDLKDISPAPTEISVSEEFMCETYTMARDTFIENTDKKFFSIFDIRIDDLSDLVESDGIDFIFLGDLFDRLLGEQEPIEYDYKHPFLFANNNDSIKQKVLGRIKSEDHGTRLCQLLGLVRERLAEGGVAVMVGCSLGYEQYFDILSNYGFRYKLSKIPPNRKELENSRCIVFRNRTEIERFNEVQLDVSNATCIVSEIVNNEIIRNRVNRIDPKKEFKMFEEILIGENKIEDGIINKVEGNKYFRIGNKINILSSSGYSVVIDLDEDYRITLHRPKEGNEKVNFSRLFTITLPDGVSSKKLVIKRYMNWREIVNVSVLDGFVRYLRE